MISFSAMPGRGVVGVQIGRNLACRRQQAVLLLMEGLMTFAEQTVDLPGRDLHTELAQFLKQQRLSHLVVVMLIQHIGLKRVSEMTGDRLRQRSREKRSVLQTVTSPSIPRIERLDSQVLHGEVSVTEKLGF